MTRFAHSFPFFDGDAARGRERRGRCCGRDSRAAGRATSSICRYNTKWLAIPLQDGNIQQFTVEGAGLKIASLSFSDGGTGRKSCGATTPFGN